MPLPRFEKLDSSRRQTILAAAADEFGRHGYDGASYNRIIAAAGVSKGAMYYYFADKDDLYRTVLDSAVHLWLGELELPLAGDDAPSFWRGVNHAYAQSLRFLLDDPSHAALCLSVIRARAEDPTHPLLIQLTERVRALVDALVAHGQSVGAIRSDIPTDLLAEVGISLMDAGDRWLARHWTDLSPKEIDTTARMLGALLRRVGSPEEKP